MAMTKKIPVAVLAATGSVGQRFIQLLDGHPLFVDITNPTAFPVCDPGHISSLR